MRTITLIIVHCSATPEGKDFKLEDIDRWHRQRGWKGCGYHYVIELDGTVRKGRDESVVGAHCKGHNKHSIGVCYIGGMEASPQPSPKGEGGKSLTPSPSPKGKGKEDGAGTRLVAADTRTTAQKVSLLSLLSALKKRYPRAIIVGHRDLDPNKACPCFNAASEYATL